jgi:hypothetical protein
MIPRQFSAKAYVYTELLGLDKALLEHIKQNFKSVYNEMAELAEKRLK